MVHSVKIEGMEEFIKGLERMADEAKFQPKDKLLEGAVRTSQTMRTLAPKRTGAFANTIDYKISGDVAEIGPDDGYYEGRPVGRAVELGRPPGQTPPPWIAIASRYGVGVASARRIAKAIGEQGTLPTLFAEKTFDALSSFYDKLGLDAANEVVNRY